METLMELFPVTHLAKEKLPQVFTSNKGEIVILLYFFNYFKYNFYKKPHEAKLKNWLEILLFWKIFSHEAVLKN